MPSQSSQENRAAIDRESVLLRTLEKFASILFRLGLDSPSAEYLLRRAFVAEAARSSKRLNTRSTQSQIALLAGVSRLEVRKILANQHRARSQKNSNRLSRVARVLAAWRHDPEFSDGHGRPKNLTCVGDRNQFGKLVRKYGRDVTARTLRDDLIKSKLAERRGDLLILTKPKQAKNLRPIAALTDLNYIYSQLAPFEFHRGRRVFLTRSLALSTSDLKLLKLAQEKAVSRVEAALNSLESLKQNVASFSIAGKKKTHHLRIAAVLTTESYVPIEQKAERKSVRRTQTRR